MDIHEHQAKRILQRYGVPIAPFAVAASEQEVDQAIQSLHLEKGVIKAQVHAGGRGKAGGVRFAKNPSEIRQIAREMIGMTITNHQTGVQGAVAQLVLLEAPTAIQKEYYVGFAIDRQCGAPILIASPDGGMDIEEIAATRPERLLTISLGADGVLKPFQLNRLVKFMGWTGNTATQAKLAVVALAKAFKETDAMLLEVNPFVVTKTGDVLALDAKLSVDDNALYRQPEIQSFYDPSQMSEMEVLAKEGDLAYVSMDGDIGCMVNGAGLAMATMDIIYYYGGKPANFLDVGGGASKEKVSIGFKILLSDPKVKAILVNIFGGILNCATLAEGLIAAALECNVTVPLIVRLEGNNVEEGRRLLKESALHILSADGLDEAAKKAVAAANEANKVGV